MRAKHHPLRIKQGSTFAYYELDLAGNVRRVRASGGADLGGYRYTAFGQTKENTATLDQPLRWKARWHYTLNGAELYDMRARQWAPEVGAFISVDEYAFHESSTTLWGWPNQNPNRYADPMGRGGDESPQWDRWASATENMSGEEKATFGAIALTAPVSIASSEGTAIGIAAWGFLSRSAAGRLVIALFAAEGAGAATVDLSKKSPPTALQGQLTGGAGECVKKTKESIETFGGEPIKAPWAHWANKLPDGTIHDPTLRGNLIERGKYVGDIPDQQTMFTMDEWRSLVSRVTE